MKFLVIANRRSGVHPDDPVASYSRAKDYYNARLADGSMDCVYTFFDQGGMAIWNAHSHEEMWEALTWDPLASIFDFEVLALVDTNHALGRVVEEYRKAQE